MPSNQILPPPQYTDGDNPRARRDDPASSHAAADESQATRKAVRHAVLAIINAIGPRTGIQLNGDYRIHLFPGVAPDSPRKRAGELAADGFLEAYRGEDGKQPALYRLTDLGRAYIDEQAAR